jgi:hypothetical protein
MLVAPDIIEMILDGRQASHQSLRCVSWIGCSRISLRSIRATTLLDRSKGQHERAHLSGAERDGRLSPCAQGAGNALWGPASAVKDAGRYVPTPNLILNGSG